MTSETNLSRLRDPFPADDIEWRVQQAGEKNGRPWARVLAYVTNRAIMERLDEVVGPESWQNVFKEGPAGGVICGLSIRVVRPGEGGAPGSAEWVTKWDGAENTDVEPVKGGLSNAMKRAAVQWGVGRGLYRLGESWAKVHDGGEHFGRTKEGTTFRWDPPTLPEWAVQRETSAGEAPATGEQLARIERLLATVRDQRVAASVRNRIALGLTQTSAGEALRYLEELPVVKAA